MLRIRTPRRAARRFQALVRAHPRPALAGPVDRVAMHVGALVARLAPGVKLGVAPGSQLHQVECFGPVLGLMRAEDLTEGLELQNATCYGLTGEISSLDDGEVARWVQGVAVGNAYVNRPITGAIVRRQPFGGWKRSAVGPGQKAGGPNYVPSLGRWSRRLPSDLASGVARDAPGPPRDRARRPGPAPRRRPRRAPGAPRRGRSGRRRGPRRARDLRAAALDA